MITVPTHAADGTAAVAAQLAPLLQAGDAVVLTGDLGAGKTTFVKGLVAALGSEAPVTSPTFTLAQRYDGGRLTVHHLDVYRLDSLGEVTDLGLDELLDDDAVTVVEWGDRIAAALPGELLEITFRLGDGDDDRHLVFVGRGRGWDRRLAGFEVPPC